MNKKKRKAVKTAARKRRPGRTSGLGTRARTLISQPPAPIPSVSLPSASPVLKVKQDYAGSEIRTIICPHPLSIERGRIDVMRPAGATVAEHLRDAWQVPDPLSTRVMLDDQVIESAQWEYLVPKAGQNLTVRAIPLGSGGGQGKDALRIVAMLGVVAASLFAPYLAPTGWGLTAVGPGGATVLTGLGSFAASSTSIALTLAVTADIPPPLPQRRLA